MQRRALAIFVFSGAAGLIFEVALQRSVARAFGVSAFATSTVLAAYMAGLALGAVLFGPLADRLARPARLYAALEAGIGLCALALPFTTRATVGWFSALARGAEHDAPAVVGGRLVLTLTLTLVPTLLMGGTLPAMGRALEGEGRLARLYAANMLGAAAGAAIAAYALLPALGISGTAWVGGALNLLAAGLALTLTPPGPPQAAPRQPDGDAPPRLISALAAWSGVVTFVAEVAWFHLLAVVVGTSAYAFGLMLAVFLLGLTLGSRWVASLTADRVSLRTLGRVQLAAAAALVVTLPLWERVPSLFLAAAPLATSFGARELVRAIACVELLLVPAAILGAVYPLLLRIVEREAALGRAAGRLAAVNTVGAVLGALGAGFVLLPGLGGRGVLVAAGVALAGVAGLLLRERLRWAAVAVALVAVALPGWNVARLASGANVYFADTGYSKGELLWARESVSSGLTSVVRSASGTSTLLTNGKFQGNDTGEVAAQRGFSQVPLVVQRRFGRALLIGVGTGCSLATLVAQPFEHVDAAELSADILEAARTHFAKVSDGVLAGHPKLTLHVADGRNVLLLSPHTYDLIALELSSIWFAGASDLYNRDFYALAKERLSSDGVVQQWVQLHHLTRRDLAVILNSAAQVFRHVHLYFVGEQGIVLASDAPLVADVARLKALSAQLAGTAATSGLPAEQLVALTGRLALDTPGVRRLVEEEARAAGVSPEALVSTDDNLALEYSTPKANVRKDLSAEALLESVNHLLADEHPVVNAVGAEDAALVKAAWLIGREDWEAARRLEATLPEGSAASLMLRARSHGASPTAP